MVIVLGGGVFFVTSPFQRKKVYLWWVEINLD